MSTTRISLAMWSPEVRTQLRSGRESEEWMAQVRIPGRELALMTRQLSALMEAGIPLVRGLDTLSQQSEHPQLAEVLWTIHDSVSNGSTLSASFAQFPRVFSPLYVRMLRIGENTGRLASNLRQLADWSERHLRVVHRVRAALAYPTFVLVLGAVLSLLIFVFIMPALMDVLEALHAPLPLITRFMMLGTRTVTTPGFWLAALSGSALLALALNNLRAGDQAATRIWLAVSRVPVLGRVLLLSAQARYAYAASALLTAGCDVTTTWTLSAESSGNPRLIEDCPRLVESIQHGNSISGAMKICRDIYGDTLIQFTRAGEEGVNLATMFQRLRGVLEEDVDLALDSFTTILEPVMVAGVALMTGFSLISIFLPLYGYLDKL